MNIPILHLSRVTFEKSEGAKKETKEFQHSEKNIKITGVTSGVLGDSVLIASGAALKALTECAKYLEDAVQKIIEDGADDPVNF